MYKTEIQMVSNDGIESGQVQIQTVHHTVVRQLDDGTYQKTYLGSDEGTAGEANAFTSRVAPNIGFDSFVRRVSLHTNMAGTPLMSPLVPAENVNVMQPDGTVNQVLATQYSLDPNGMDISGVSNLHSQVGFSKVFYDGGGVNLGSEISERSTNAAGQTTNIVFKTFGPLERTFDSSNSSISRAFTVPADYS